MFKDVKLSTTWKSFSDRWLRSFGHTAVHACHYIEIEFDIVVTIKLWNEFHFQQTINSIFSISLQNNR